jgi:hypothetical protein
MERGAKLSVVLTIGERTENEDEELLY